MLANDNDLPRGAFTEDEALLLYKIAQRLVRERGLSVEEFLKLAEHFARDNPDDEEPSHG